MRFIWVILFCPLLLAQNANQKIDAYSHGLKIIDTHGIAKAQEFYLKCHKTTGDKMCYFGLAYTLFENHENEKALKMVEIMKATGNHGDLYFGHLYNLEGQALNRTRRWEEGKTALRKAFDYYETAKHKENQYLTMINLGNACLRQGDLKEAEKCFEYATFLSINESYNSGRLYELRAISELTRNNHKAAVFFAELAILEHQKLPSYISLANSLAYLAIAKHHLGEPTQSYLDQAKAISQKHNFKVPDWVKIVQAYINRCNDKAKYMPYFQKLLENESCYFLTGFYEGALQCP